MDKQKQIEEMAKDYYGYSIDLEDDCKFVAEEMYNKGHRKISEDEVVLTREEYEKLKLFEERVRSGVCFTQKEWFDYCQKDSNERTSLLIKAKKDTRKETAEKFMSSISNDVLVVNTKEYGNIEVVPLDRISEICENIIKGDK